MPQIFNHKSPKVEYTADSICITKLVSFRLLILISISILQLLRFRLRRRFVSSEWSSADFRSLESPERIGPNLCTR